MSDMAGQSSQLAVITDRFPDARAKPAHYGSAASNAARAELPVLVALIESGHRTHNCA